MGSGLAFTQDLTPALPGSAVSLAADGLGPDLLPLGELADCVETALGRDGKTILSYGPAAGYTPLRELIGGWFGVHPSRVVLTNGRLHGLALLSRLLLPMRSVIAEYPIHDRAEGVFLAAGASLIAVPVGEEGMVVEDLQNTLGQYVRPAMVYAIPNFHNPTGWTTGREARSRVVDLVIRQNLVQTEQILLVEDDTYGLTRFEGEPLPALFDLSGGRSAYSSSFSATIAPGLRVGFFVLPEGLADELGELATSTYITPVLLAQAAVFEFLDRGALEPHLARLREGLKTRRDAMLTALETHLPDATWSRPEGGFFVWVQLPGYQDGREVLKRAEGVTACDGTRFGAVSSALRLSFAFAAPDEIETGVERLAAAL
jgi:DNA-binding transcriptional MocR family regulator